MNPSVTYQSEMSNKDISQRILENIVKMFDERGLINMTDKNKDEKYKMESEELSKIAQEYVDKFVIIDFDDNKYTMEFEKENIKYKCVIKIFNQKVTIINKNSQLNEFLSKYKNDYKLIIVDEINEKSLQSINSMYNNTEVFKKDSLMTNLIENGLVPRYQVIDKQSDDYKNFYDDYLTKKRNLPRILLHDPMAKYYNLKKDDIVRVIRASETSGISNSYRIVV